MRRIDSFSGLYRDRRAATAVIFAVAAVPLFSLIALAVDYSGLVAARAQLSLAADAGVLMATQDTAFQAGTRSAAEFPTDAGKTRFRLQAAGVASAKLKNVDLSVQTSGTVYTGTITYTASYTPMFAGLIGLSSIPITGTAKAVAVTKVYVDFQIIIDTSDSMTIASDAYNAGRMNSVLEAAWNSPNQDAYAGQYAGVQTSGCAFACHFGLYSSDPAQSDPGQGNEDFYSAAVQGGVVMRLTQAKTAANAFASQVLAKASDQFRIGLYTAAFRQCVVYQPSSGAFCDFSEIAQVQSLSSDVAAVQNAIPGVEPEMRRDWNGYYSGNTDLSDSLAEFKVKYLGTPGDGSTAAAPKKFVLLFTDGANNVSRESGNSSFMSSIAEDGLDVSVGYPRMDLSKCEAIKTAGATLVVIQTLAPDFALPPPQQDDTLTPDEIRQDMTACASSNMYFTVDKQQDFINAMTNALNVAMTEPTHFSQ